MSASTNQTNFYNNTLLQASSYPPLDVASSRFAIVTFKLNNISKVGTQDVSTLTSNVDDQSSKDTVKFLAVGVNVSQNANVARQFVLGSHIPEILTGTVINNLQFSMLASNDVPAVFHLLGRVINAKSPTFKSIAEIQLDGNTSDKTVGDSNYFTVTITYGPGSDHVDTFKQCVVASYSISVNAGDVVVLENVAVQCGYYE